MRTELCQALSLIYANAHATAQSTPYEIKSLYEEAMKAYDDTPVEEPVKQFDWPDPLKD